MIRRPGSGILAIAGLIAVAGTLAGCGGKKTVLPPAVPANPKPTNVGSTQCPPVKGATWVYPANVKMSSDTYEAFTVGFSCATAASYIKQIVGRTLPANAAYEEQPLPGIPGFLCTAYPDKNGHAYGGSCRKGATEFGWNLNVLFQSTDLEGDNDITSNGDATVVLRLLGPGRYELEVQNTSRIGYIKSFHWTPPRKLKILAVTSSSRGKCGVDPAGEISCALSLPPPKCLCRPSGGSVTIDFTTPPAVVLHIQGHAVNPGVLGARLQIVAMTPIHYLVPATLEQERQGHL
ncbi:MAG TPA: hypothetical protein VG652_10340 [Gaiellaceae bacterium]|nr:hypothetical protein [Gaiellaceae bacterium]